MRRASPATICRMGTAQIRSHKSGIAGPVMSKQTQAPVCSVTEAASPNLAFRSSAKQFMRRAWCTDHPLIRAHPKPCFGIVQLRAPRFWHSAEQFFQNGVALLLSAQSRSDRGQSDPIVFRDCDMCKRVNARLCPAKGRDWFSDYARSRSPSGSMKWALTISTSTA